jgi:hypothetical protein
MSTMQKQAHNILENTIIGFVGPSGRLLRVTYNYEVADLVTGEIVSTGGPRVDNSTTVDTYATKVASHTHAVYGHDIAPGISMTFAKRDDKPKQKVGITITTMRVGGPGNSWSVVEPLAQRHAVCLMRGWYIEHGLMDLYMRNKYTAFSGFQEWVSGHLIEFFSPGNKFQWYGHAMDIDYEMETKACGFTECLCDTKVPALNGRHVIPNKYYDRFGLLDAITRMRLWAKGKPQTEAEADMILHKARLREDTDSMDELMRPILRKAARRERARLTGITLDKKAVRELLIEAKALEDDEAKSDLIRQKAEDIQTMTKAFQEKHKRDLASGDGETGGRRRGGITWAGPVKYVDPFRGAEEGARLSAHEVVVSGDK